MEYSILSANGLLASSTGSSSANGVSASSTSSSKAAAPTQGMGGKVKAAGVMAAGFVGAVMVL